MKKLAKRFKNRDIGSLEQACERYATMAYEVFRRELAIPFKSTTTSYMEDDTGRSNDLHFSATFIPREGTVMFPHSRSGHCNTRVTFRVLAETGAGAWILTDGRVYVLDGSAQSCIRFSLDYKSMGLHIPSWDLIRVGVSHDCEEMPDTPVNVETWRQLPGMVRV